MSLLIGYRKFSWIFGVHINNGLPESPAPNAGEFTEDGFLLKREEIADVTLVGVM